MYYFVQTLFLLPPTLRNAKAARYVSYAMSPGTPLLVISQSQQPVKNSISRHSRAGGRNVNSFVRHLAAGKGSPYLLGLLDGCMKHSRTLRNDCAYVLPSVRSEFGKRRIVFCAIAALKA